MSGGTNRGQGSISVLKFIKEKMSLILQLLVIITIAGITVFLMFRGKEARKIIHCLKEAKKCWIGVAIVLMVFFLFVEAVQLKMIFKGMAEKLSLWKCFLLSNVEYFFAQVTPGAAGGQPIQMIFMSRFGVDVLVGALACMMIAVLYKSAFLTIFLVALIARRPFVCNAISRVPILFTFGVCFQVISIGFLLLCIFRPSVASVIVNGLITCGGKLHVLKHPEETRQKAADSIAMYRRGSTYLKENKFAVFRMFIYTIAQRLAYFSVTFCVAKSLGVPHVDWFGVVAVQAILSLSVDALPIPGAAGANELVFVNLQRKLFEPEIMAAGLLLNRGITYYFLLICCGIFTILCNLAARRKNRVQNG